MALDLRPDMPTAHITWEGRGFPEDAEHDDSLQPADGNGPCQGLRYSVIFRRRGPGVFGVRGISSFPYDPDHSPVYRAALGLGTEPAEGSGSWDTYSIEIPVLDGFVHYEQPCEGRRSATLDVHGNEALRLLCHRLGITQPPRFPDETSVPDCSTLEWNLWRQLGEPMDDHQR